MHTFFILYGTNNKLQKKNQLWQSSGIVGMKNGSVHVFAFNHVVHVYPRRAKLLPMENSHTGLYLISMHCIKTVKLIKQKHSKPPEIITTTWPHNNNNDLLLIFLLKVTYFATLTHCSNEERMLQRDVEASTRDADIWTNSTRLIKGFKGKTSETTAC